MTEVAVSPGEFADLVAGALAGYAVAGAGAAPAAAETDTERVVRWLLQAERLGLHAFGADMLVRELARHGGPADGAGRVSSGERRADPDPAGYDWVIDASGIPGQLALAAAVRKLSAGAQSAPISAVSIQRVGALGVLGLAARDLAARGLVGVVCANSAAIVAPWGGHAGAIGTNPLAVAAPRADGPPLVLDFASSPMTMADLARAKDTGAPLHEGAGFGADGLPTRDPSNVTAIAAESRIASLTGLALEMLARAVGGPAPGRQPGMRTALLLAVNPALFGSGAVGTELEQLAADWIAAGGHLPQRFDALGTATGAALGGVNLKPATLAALQRNANVKGENDND